MYTVVCGVACCVWCVWRVACGIWRVAYGVLVMVRVRITRLVIYDTDTVVCAVLSAACGVLLVLLVCYSTVGYVKHHTHGEASCQPALTP